MARGPAREGGPGDPRAVRMNTTRKRHRCLMAPRPGTRTATTRTTPRTRTTIRTRMTRTITPDTGTIRTTAVPARRPGVPPPPLAGAALAARPGAGRGHAGRDRVRCAVRAHPVGQQRPGAGPGHRPGAPRGYPGPPVPALFAESLVATEDHRFYSEPGMDIYASPGWLASQVTGHGDAGRRHPLPAAGQDAVHARARAGSRRGQAGHARHQARPGLQQGRRSCGCTPTWPTSATATTAWPGQLRVLRHRPGGPDPARGGHAGRAGPGALGGRPDRALRGGRAREAHVLGRLVATGKITQAQSTAAYAQRLRLVGGSGTGCAGPR